MHRRALAAALLAASLSVPAVAGPAGLAVEERSLDPSGDRLAAAPHAKAATGGGNGNGNGSGNANGNGNGNPNGNPNANANGNADAPATAAGPANGPNQGGPDGTGDAKPSQDGADSAGKGAGYAGSERPVRRVEPSVEDRPHGKVARAEFHGQQGERVGVALGRADGALRGLTLRLERAASVAVEVAVIGADAPAARAAPPGFRAHRQLDIHVAAADGAIAGGDLAFSLPAADLAGAPPSAVVVLHGVGEAWEALPTQWVVAPDGSVDFLATTPSFSPFLIAFDLEPPAVREVAPEGTVARAARITAAVADARGVDGTLTRMVVDGVPVEARWDQGALVYEPAAALAEGLHVVAVSAVDLGGLSSLRSWSFTVVGSASAAPGGEDSTSPAAGQGPQGMGNATPLPSAAGLLLVLAVLAWAAPRRPGR